MENEPMFVITATAVAHSLDEAMRLIDESKKDGFISSILEV